MNKGFKLLAIRPLNGCDKRFLKNLKKGTIYKFYNEYTFYNKLGNEIKNENDFSLVTKVDCNKSIPDDLYKFVSGNGININISALVGKNGSGKSSLLELLYASCYVIASRKQILKDTSFYNELFLGSKISPEEAQKKTTEIQSVYDDLNVEFFYQINECIYGVQLYDSGIFHYIIEGENEKFSNEILNVKGYKDDETLESNLKFVLNEVFFYTISINYSLYGLNSKSTTDLFWVEELFHKIDGYQTPVVINPFRREGNIDVNTELHLAQTRLLTNIILDDENKHILIGKEIDTIIFEIDNEKYEGEVDEKLDIYLNNFKEEYGSNEVLFFTNVYNIIYGGTEYGNIDPFIVPRPQFEFLIKYIFRKIIKISHYYKEYKGNTIIQDDKVIFKNFFTFLRELKGDRSHITLKLRQTLNIIRFNLLSEEKQPENYESWIQDENGNYCFKIKIDRLIKRITNITKLPDYRGEFFYEELVPISCFNIIIWVKNNQNLDSVSNLDVLSSGEQHLIHSIQSIIYHILNINSVSRNQANKIKYNYINLVLDEIELYFHPEFQRTFLFELLNKIQNLKIEHIKGINLLFCTHSPFILSDIPQECTLKLDNGEIRYSFNKNTFGANIHDLLDDDFYLSNGFMGEFARDKILSLISFLDEEDIAKRGIRQVKGKYKWSKENSYEFINIIGEPVLKSTLRELYFKKYNDMIDEEIEKLTELKKRVNDNDR